MIDLTVARGDGLIQGEDISDTLITAESVGIQRGRNAIDSNSKVQVVQLSCLYVPGLKTGATVRVLDALMGEEWFGKITSLDVAYSDGQQLASLQVERPV